MTEGRKGRPAGKPPRGAALRACTIAPLARAALANMVEAARIVRREAAAQQAG